jgi:hypothetical protein
VQADQDTVLGEREVLLDVIGALLEGQRVGGDRVLGRVGGRAAMRDEEGAGRRGAR